MFKLPHPLANWAEDWYISRHMPAVFPATIDQEGR
jgi:hypothetical protein